MLSRRKSIEKIHGTS